MTKRVQKRTMRIQMNAKGDIAMASSVLQVRIEEGLRSQAAAIYEDLGIDLQTAVRIFIKRSVMDNGLPFSMTLERKASNAGIRAIENMRNAAEAAGLSEMSLDEINAEIAASRAERAAKKEVL